MYAVFVGFFKYVICCDFFSHSKYIFTFIPNFCIIFLKVGPRSCKSFRPHTAWTYPCPCFSMNSYNTHMDDTVLHGLSPSVLSVLFWSCTTCKRMIPFIMVGLSPSILSGLFWSRTTCKCITPFITVYHRQYCFILNSYNMHTHDDVHHCLFITIRILCFALN